MEKRNYQPSLLWSLAEAWYLSQLETPPVAPYRTHELTLYVYRNDTDGAYMLTGPKMYWQDEPMIGQHFQHIEPDDMREHSESLGEVVIWDRRLRKTAVIGKTYEEAWKKIS